MKRNALLAAALVAALALAGCSASRTQQTPGAAAQTPQPAPAGSGATATPAGPGGEAQATAGAHILTPAPAGALAYATYAPGQTVPQTAEGLYRMEAATGKVEAWTLPAGTASEHRPGAGFSTSADGSYIIVRGADQGWLAAGETAYQWDRSQYELVAASAGALVFEQVEPAPQATAQWFRAGWGPGGRFAWTGRFTVLGPDFRQRTVFTLPTTGETNDRPALFSPDGKQLTLVAGGKLYLVDLASGTTRLLDEGVGGVALAPLNDGASFYARALPGVADNVPTRRYTWDGRTLPPMPAGTPSPDGSLVVSKVWVGSFTPATVVTDASIGEPVIRILGGDLCRGDNPAGSPWSADSAVLLIGTRQGERQVSVTGTLSQPAALQGEGWHNLLPSPAARDLLVDRLSQADGTHRLRVADETGKVLAEAAFGAAAAGLWPAAIPLWHPTGKWLQVSLFHKGGSDGPCGDYAIPLPAKVQRAPFPPDLTVQVQNTGDCLVLRAEVSANSTRLACLKDGIRLTVTEAEQLKHGNWLTAQTWGDGGQWAHVRTPGGQEGWVTLEGGYLTWAD